MQKPEHLHNMGDTVQKPEHLLISFSLQQLLLFTVQLIWTIMIYLFCREVWPENDSFGHAGLAPEEEFLSMREIFMTDIGQPTGK